MARAAPSSMRVSVFSGDEIFSLEGDLNSLRRGLNFSKEGSIQSQFFDGRLKGIFYIFEVPFIAGGVDLIDFRRSKGFGTHLTKSEGQEILIVNGFRAKDL